jgi:PAS domain S-box-containing protein
MTNDSLHTHEQLPEISSIIEAIGRGIFATDPSGNCTFINRTALDLLDYRKEDCLGKNMHHLIHYRHKDGNPYPQSECAICNVRNNLTIQNSADDEVFWKADGTPFDIRYSSNAILENGVFKGTVIAFSDISEQKNRQIAIAESEKKYKYIFENNPSPMFIWDFETLRIVDCNIEALMKYGYSRAEFLQLNIRDIRPREDINRINAATRNESTYGEIHHATWRHKKKNGDIMYVEVTGHLIDFNGRKSSLVLINDITDKLRAENELKKSEEKLRLATEIARLGYWQKDIDGKNRYWSDELYKIWGVSKDTFTLDYDSFCKAVHPDDQQKFEQEQDATLSGKKEIDFIYRIVLPDGKTKWLHEIGKAVENEKGQPVIFRGTVQDITAQKQLSLSLEESNLRYSLVTKATSDAIWDWDLEKGTVYWGDGVEVIFGYSLSNLEPSIGFWIGLLHPDEKERIMKGIYAVIEGTGTNWKDEYRYLKADGTYAFVVNRGFVIRDPQGKAMRMAGAMHDITQRKTEEQRLKLLESVVTNTNDAVLITEAEPFDEPGPRIIYVNDAFTRMTGYTSAEVIGKTPRILQGPKSDKGELNRLGECLRDWKSCEITTVNYKKNGEEFWLNFSISPVANESGWFTHWVAVERDVTEQKKAETELRLFTDELFKRNKELQQFGYIISHNLRSPVANILGIANLLEMEKDDPETIAHCARSLTTATTSLDHVIKDLNQILSINDHAAELMKEPVNLNELIGIVIADLLPMIERAGAMIETDLGPVVLNLHKAYLYSIFFNLISNSIKYRSMEAPRIRITAENTDQNTTIKVSDNGIGIDLVKHKEELFKPYKRFETSVEGKGLGLFLIKSHVDALNGTLTLASEPGKGTTFIFDLPNGQR